MKADISNHSGGFPRAFNVVRSGRFAATCALLAFASLAHAQTTNYFYEGFETAQSLDDWFADNGTWEIGRPTFGPPTNSIGRRAFAGTNCAATVLGGNYPYGQVSRLISPVFTVPPAVSNPRLRFWHWYSFAGTTGGGRVQIKVGTNAWVSISPEYPQNGSDVWTRALIDLSAYAGEPVQLGFYFTAPSASFSGVGAGWYVDEIAVVNGPVTFNNPENWEEGLGDWYAETGTWEVGMPTSGPSSAHQGTNCAATVLGGNYAYGQVSRLISPVFTVPPAISNPRLRFWHWYSFGGTTGGGRVQIKVGTNAWVSISPEYAQNGGGVWTRPLIDLSAYAGEPVRLGFYFTAPGASFSGVGAGWYVDEVRLTHDFALLLLDSPIVRAQDNFCVALGIAESSPASNLSFTLQAPAGNLGNVTLNGEGCWTNAVIAPQPNSQWLVTLQNSCASAPMGVQIIGSLCFSAVSPHSAFVPLSISNLVVTNLDASIPTAHAFGSRAVIIANEPLLEATMPTNGQRLLTLFGKPDTRYEIQHADDLGGLISWLPGWTNTVPTNMFYSFPIDGSFSNRPALYLRALEK